MRFSVRSSKLYSICFILKFPVNPNKGGVQRVTSLLGQYFMNEGYEVFYFIYSETLCNSNVDGIKQFSLSTYGNSESNNKNVVQHFVENYQIDVIINQSGFDIGLLNMLTFVRKKNKGIVIYSVHHNCITCLFENYKEILLDNASESSLLRFLDSNLLWKLLIWRGKYKYKYAINKALRISNRVVLLSESFIEELRQYSKYVSESNVAAIANPISFPHRKIDTSLKENRLLYIGRLDYPQKRVDLILDVWSMLEKQNKNWHFDVLGDGPMHSWLIEEAKMRSLNRITFHGYQNPEPFLNRSKVLCLTSAFEGFGMVLTEAQVKGVVPVSTFCYKGITNIIEDDFNGYIIDKFNIPLMSERIATLFSDRQKYLQLSNNGYLTSKRFRIKNIGSEWLQMIVNE